MNYHFKCVRYRYQQMMVFRCEFLGAPSCQRTQLVDEVDFGILDQERGDSCMYEVYVNVYVHIYVYIYIFVCVYIYIYIYIRIM